MIRLLLFVFIVPLAFHVKAQDDDLYFNGIIRDAITGDSLPGCMVQVQQDRDGLIRNVPVNENGEFLWSVAPVEGPRSYTFHFKAEGHIPQEWRMDASGLGAVSDNRDGWVLLQDVRLLPGERRAQKNKCVFNSRDSIFKCSGVPDDRIWSGFVELVIPTLHADKYAAIDTLPGLNIYGYVRDHWTKDKIPGAEVLVTVDGAGTNSTILHTDAFGFYACSLPFDGTYNITYSQIGMVSKTIVLDMHNVPVEDRVAGFGAHVDVRLFPPISGEDLSFLDEPLGRMSYDPALQNMAWDMQITAPLLERLDAILKRSRE